jgi:hypothetical protein
MIVLGSLTGTWYLVRKKGKAAKDEEGLYKPSGKRTYVIRRK